MSTAKLQKSSFWAVSRFETTDYYQFWRNLIMTAPRDPNSEEFQEPNTGITSENDVEAYQEPNTGATQEPNTGVTQEPNTN